MNAVTFHKTKIILDSEDYETLDNAVAMLQDILDLMEEEGYDHCTVGDEEWSPELFEDLLGGLHAIYEGDITLE